MRVVEGLFALHFWMARACIWNRRCGYYLLSPVKAFAHLHLHHSLRSRTCFPPGSKKIKKEPLHRFLHPLLDIPSRAFCSRPQKPVSQNPLLPPHSPHTSTNPAPNSPSSPSGRRNSEKRGAFSFPEKTKFHLRQCGTFCSIDSKAGSCGMLVWDVEWDGMGSWWVGKRMAGERGQGLRVVAT